MVFHPSSLPIFIQIHHHEGYSYVSFYFFFTPQVGSAHAKYVLQMPENWLHIIFSHAIDVSAFLTLENFFSTLSQVLSTILSNFILKYRPNREMAPGESS